MTLSSSEGRSPNRLSLETSPYLLQHQFNPVDWYPWGTEAIEQARREQKPIFLSVGYSACHWCHVMERETFENAEIATLMNRHFINIKVDREERPDIDSIYMSAVQALSGQGGWPMSVFLTPELRPFFGGTYFPPHDSRGMPGFDRVLVAVRKAWDERRNEVLQSATDLTTRIDELNRLPQTTRELDSSLLAHAARQLARAFEPRFGGFGAAPKFPHPMDLRLALRLNVRNNDEHALHIARHTLDQMARGGIYDHLGGGFARYSTDDRWLVPHFEKMLYDNALLALTYTEAYQLTSEPEFARVASETIDYVLARMTSPKGGFYATEDADSEGEEGKYYVWTRAEILSLLGPDKGAAFAAVYDVTEAGNWEGRSILNLPRTIAEVAREIGRDATQLRAEIAESRGVLLKARDQRVPPAKDTKVLCSWNGLMLSALCEAAFTLDCPDYLDAARRCASFLIQNVRQADGRLYHSIKDGRATLNAYLDDYTNLVDGLTRLFETTGESRWLDVALELADILVAEFHDPDHGGFFYTGQTHEALIVRQKDSHDSATPSGNAMAATALLRLAALTGRDDLLQLARTTLEFLTPLLDRAPTAVGQSLIALDFYLAEPVEIAVVAPDTVAAQPMLSEIYHCFLPSKVVAIAGPNSSTTVPDRVPLLANRPMHLNRPTTYVCRNHACLPPINDRLELQCALDGLMS